MRHARNPLVALVCLASLAGCGPEPTPPRAPNAPPASNHSPVAPSAPGVEPKFSKTSRPAQEVAFIRECLAVGLRPTILLELERKAVTQANGQAIASGPTKAQLHDLRDNFAESATKLTELAASPAAGRRATFAQILAEARTKQAANCSRLPDELVHGEAVGLMMREFIKITAEASNYQEADRRAGEHLKQIWPELINLPAQQKAAMEAILKAEQEFRQVIITIDKEPDLQLIQRDAVIGVIRSLEARAQTTATAMNTERFYATLLGMELKKRPWKIEAGEMLKLLVTEQKVVGHCIISRIRLDVRGRVSGRNVSFDLSVIHHTYADGRPAVLQVIEH
jgi:predicted small lipoprotein YifL